MRGGPAAAAFDGYDLRDQIGVPVVQLLHNIVFLRGRVSE